MARAFWWICGMISLGLGLIGIVLPLVPTVPLVLLAAFCFARSSESMHGWLVQHPKFGPGIENWQKHRAISKRAKKLATVSIAAVVLISVLISVPLRVLILQVIFLSGTLLFIWTRPDGPGGGSSAG